MLTMIKANMQMITVSLIIAFVGYQLVTKANLETKVAKQEKTISVANTTIAQQDELIIKKSQEAKRAAQILDTVKSDASTAQVETARLQKKLNDRSELLAKRAQELAGFSGRLSRIALKKPNTLKKIMQRGNAKIMARIEAATTYS